MGTARIPTERVRQTDKGNKLKLETLKRKNISGYE